MPNRIRHTAADFHRCSPLRTVDWRWQRAVEINAAGDRPQRRDDRWISLAVRYQRAVAKASTKARFQSLCRRMPHLVAAHTLHLEGGLIADEITARLLAGEAADAISNKTGTPVSVIETFAAIFFDVTEAVHAGSHDWLMASALGFAPWKPCVPTEAQIWRYLGIVGGPFVVDLMIADYLGRPEPCYVNRHEQAEKGRFLAREFAADWSSPRAAAGVIDEGCRLFGDTLDRPDTDPLLGLQVDLLRHWAGLEPMPALEERQGSLKHAPAGAGKDTDEAPHETQAYRDPPDPGVPADAPGTAVG